MKEKEEFKKSTVSWFLTQYSEFILNLCALKSTGNEKSLVQ